MIAIISANLAPEAPAQPLTPSANSRKRSSRLPAISCRSNVLRFHLKPAAMFIAQAVDTPQMLRDVDSGRSVRGAHDVRARCLPQFPVPLDLKPKLNFAAFCQASLFAGISRDARRCRAGTRCKRNAVSAGKPRRNPVLERYAVSMPAKICGH
ncbi:hypothetical protein IVB22_19505 [Bradyrhizobium sp. 190]|uniref:hypothetical protein n=1 Tax=Bradyrhizobium sp. 190 TaxID=2782658 RepID=UPI001FF9B1EE|nr:hypothetical protein [Bradyrhizobium sp. 190]MCK1514706.1 hypothetical protein [Bradyrhizobium sp. 190]